MGYEDTEYNRIMADWERRKRVNNVLALGVSGVGAATLYNLGPLARAGSSVLDRYYPRPQEPDPTPKSHMSFTDAAKKVRKADARFMAGAETVKAKQIESVAQ